MKADYASHLLRSPIAFELFLFSYLISALCLQNVLIYKTNVYLVDFNLVLFTVAVLLRRPALCALMQLQTHLTQGKNKTTGLRQWLQLRKLMVVVSTVLVIVWSAVELISNTSLFNLLFLFYPLLLYLSLFGFTMEPRVHRSRFQPPRGFLEDPEGRKIPRRMFPTLPVFAAGVSSPQTLGPMILLHKADFTNQSDPPNRERLQSEQAGSSNEDVETLAKAQETPPAKYVPKYTWEYSLLLQTGPDEIRREVDILISDLTVRLKQLLFNSLFCAYYVGFIPMQFADSRLYYDKWWCMEHAFLVWANSFVILTTHLLPPSYCQLLFQCSMNLGCWTRCTHSDTHNLWSPDYIWPCETVVQWNGESFKGEGPQNVSIPCNSSQEFFYFFFSSRHHVYTWLLAMQCVLVTFQIVVLLRCTFWFQFLSMSVLLTFNSYIFYLLLYNRLRCRQTRLIS
jgi:hypothetical protein